MEVEHHAADGLAVDAAGAQRERFSDDVMQELRVAFKAVPVPVLLVNPLGEIVLTNAALDALFGYPSGQLGGRPVEVLVPQTVREYHPELRDAFLERPVSRPMGTGRDLFGLARDGRMIPVEIGLNPVDVGAGRWVLASVLDITERKKQEERVRLALDAAASAMIMVDHEGRVVLVNAQACEQFGYQEEELLGERVEMLVPVRARRRHGVYRNGYLRSPERRGMGGSRDLHGLRKDGSEFPVEIGLTPMAVGDNAYTMATVIDVSDTRRHEAEIERRNEELRHLNEELNAFAYGASHDLKAPLSSISGLLAVAVRDLAAGRTEQVAAVLERAQSLAASLAARVEGVLGVATQDSAGDGVAEFSLRCCIEESLQSLVPQMERQGVERRLEFAHAEPVVLDRARLVVVLDNLLANALKFADLAKGERYVAVSTADDGETLTLVVEDNGLGIPAAQQQRVFHAFARAGNHDLPGTGLGLSLVRKHVMQMRGRVELSSSPAGTRFTVRLPRVGRAEHG